jgi:hypothetical protein
MQSGGPSFDLAIGNIDKNGFMSVIRGLNWITGWTYFCTTWISHTQAALAAGVVAMSAVVRGVHAVAKPSQNGSEPWYRERAIFVVRKGRNGFARLRSLESISLECRA